MRFHAVILTAAVAAGASAQPIDGVRTIFLEAPSQDWGAPMNVAYHAGFDQYYSGGGGFTANSGAVYDGGGNVIQDSEVVVDLRALNYNPNTGDMEAATFAANTGGTDRGLRSLGLDGGGLYDGTSAELLPSMPGLFDNQTMPAYDAANNVYYSATRNGDTVNVVDRADGSLIRSFSLDLSGGRSNSSYAVGYAAENGWIVIADSVLDQIHAFDTNGNYIGSSNLDMDVASLYGFGYTNGQAFVWDQARGGWQGYRIKGDDDCAADLDGDGDTDADDFFAYLDAFANGDLSVCDIDGDGDCDADDFFGYLDLFAQGC